MFLFVQKKRKQTLFFTSHHRKRKNEDELNVKTRDQCTRITRARRKSSFLLCFNRNSFVHLNFVLERISTGSRELVVWIKKQDFFKCLESRLQLFLLLIGVSEVVPSCDIARLKLHGSLKLSDSLFELSITDVTDAKGIVDLLHFMRKEEGTSEKGNGFSPVLWTGRDSPCMERPFAAMNG